MHTCKAAELLIVQGVQMQELLECGHYLQCGRLQVVLAGVVGLISEVLYRNLQGAVMHLQSCPRVKQGAKV